MMSNVNYIGIIGVRQPVTTLPPYSPIMHFFDRRYDGGI